MNLTWETWLHKEENTQQFKYEIPPKGLCISDP